MSKYASEYDVSKDRLGSGGAASLSSWILTLKLSFVSVQGGYWKYGLQNIWERIENMMCWA